MRRRIVPWMHMPADLRVVLAIDAAMIVDQGEGGFAGQDVDEHLDEHVIDKVDAQVQHIDVEDPHRERGYDGRGIASRDDFAEDLLNGQANQPYASSSRCLRVTMPSHSR